MSSFLHTQLCCQFKKNNNAAIAVLFYMLENIPILIDFDGVLNVSGKVPEDAKEFLNFLINNNIPTHILSNSTLKTGDEIKAFLKSNSLPYVIPCMTAVDATVQYIKTKNLKVSVYCDKNIINYFDSFIKDDKPDAVVIGDLGDGWNYKILNEIFNKVLSGSEIIAMQMNKYWIKNNKPNLDAGSFVSVIEYASSKKATVIGKPSQIYFKEALKFLDFPEDNKFIMIGDDIYNDIEGAQKLGGKGILIYTGKTTKDIAESSGIIPEWEVNNLKEIKKLLISFN